MSACATATVYQRTAGIDAMVRTDRRDQESVGNNLEESSTDDESRRGTITGRRTRNRCWSGYSASRLCGKAADTEDASGSALRLQQPLTTVTYAGAAAEPVRVTGMSDGVNSDGRGIEQERGIPSTRQRGLHQEQSKGRPVSVGLLTVAVPSDLDQLIADVRNSSHDFVVVDLLKRSTLAFEDGKGAGDDVCASGADRINASVRRYAAHFNRHELHVRDADWSEYLVGRVADWLQLDSSHRRERTASELLLKKQIAWATYIGLSALLFPLPVGQEPIVNYMRCLNSHLPTMGYTQVWIRIPLIPSGPSGVASFSCDDERDENASWERWNIARLLCEHSAKLRVALEITSDLPAPRVIDRWFAEPLSAALIPTEVFTMDRRGFPVLSRRHQSVVKRLIQHGCQIVISTSDYASPLPAHPCGSSCYADYIRRLAGDLPPLSVVEMFATGYQDYLQAPLQPLADNLEAATYATFEKDPVKYERYEDAVRRALVDRVAEADAKMGMVTTVMVVGAGAKGPLVNCCIRASEISKRKIKVFAVEKNPNSLVTLQQIKEELWFDQVSIVHADMRFWEAPEKADILVSELLGSLGDNELSPECLDGAQRFLKDDGICIPASYTAYVAPLSSAKLYSEAAAYRDQLHLETPYVVMFKSVDHVAEPQKCWEFHHPNRFDVVDRLPPDNLHNTRYCHLRFSSEHGAMLHGLAGYFESVLYRDVMLSTLPRTHSPGMFSWFPLFFPLKTPLHLPAGSAVDVRLWRLTDAKKVWYEWAATVFRSDDGTFLSSSGISNANGRSSWIGL